MANNKDSSDSKTKKSTFCGHLMPSFDTHRYCYKCRESGKGDDDDLCTVKKHCLFILWSLASRRVQITRRWQRFCHNLLPFRIELLR